MELKHSYRADFSLLSMFGREGFFLCGIRNGLFVYPSFNYARLVVHKNFTLKITIKRPKNFPIIE